MLALLFLGVRWLRAAPPEFAWQTLDEPAPALSVVHGDAALAVPAGPHHVMHQCIDAHTEEMFFLPEYVGPADAESQAAHRMQWPQVINAAPKLPQHKADEPLNYALGEGREAQATVGPSSSDSDRTRRL